jgi:membrane-bound lytic murein transglycosylase F
MHPKQARAGLTARGTGILVGMTGPAGTLRGALVPARRWARPLFAGACILLLATCTPRPGVLERARLAGELRIATLNSPTAYYLGAHGQAGLEYQLASRFAAAIGVPARFVVVDSAAAVLREVATGRAHIGAAGLAVTPSWRRIVTFSRPYQEQKLHIVHREDRPLPQTVDALGNRSLEVARGSAHDEALAAIARVTPGLHYRVVPDADTFDLLNKVYAGELDATIADTNEYSLARNHHPELRAAQSLPGSEALAWALPNGDAELKARVDGFLEDSVTEVNELLARYYAPGPGRFKRENIRTLIREAPEKLPRLQKYFQDAASEFGGDWRVLAAIAYEESKWDPNAVSPTGVRGIMMLTADTAEELEVADRGDIAQSIRGGARYLKQMLDTIPERIPDPDRTWLALAAYNIGYGHLEDARVLTQASGKDPNSWQDVRAVLPLLAQERWYTKAKRGYARGWEAVRFVDEVRGYLDAIEWATPDPSVVPAVPLPARPHTHAPASSGVLKRGAGGKTP